MEFYSLSSAGINHTQQTRGLLCVLKVAVLLVATKGGSQEAEEATFRSYCPMEGAEEGG